MSPLSPVFRISTGLVIVTCSILLVLDLAGVVPQPADALVDSRIRLCETLAAQTAAAADRNDLASIRAALQMAVRRNDDVLSAGLRGADGRVLVVTGDHRALWILSEEDRSPATHVEIPIFKGGKRWANVEVRFASLGGGSVLETLWERPLVRLLLIFGAIAFVAFLVYMRRTLRHLDPSAVIPTRVQTALDVMAEGVLVLDEVGRIVLANAAFAERLGRSTASVLGIRASELGWRVPNLGTRPTAYPWSEAIRENKASAEVRLNASMDDSEEVRSFVVKAAPVLDGWGRAKGAIVTFDDVTELERKTTALERTLAELEKSQEEVRLQNEELQVLARRDPLTGVSNRRAFLEAFETYFVTARREGHQVSCVMADIDHFKAINDSHGHLTGDEVIQRVSETLASAVRSTDAVCRYGGEEFCIVLPDTPIEAAAAVAERLRRSIDSPGFARVPVTVSFGVSSIASGAETLPELINQADEALYASKGGGRNRVTRWDERGAAAD